MDNICGTLNHCSRKVEQATRQAEIMVDNIWNHREFSSICPIAETIYLSRYLSVYIHRYILT